MQELEKWIEEKCLEFYKTMKDVFQIEINKEHIDEILKKHMQNTKVKVYQTDVTQLSEEFTLSMSDALQSFVSARLYLERARKLNNEVQSAKKRFSSNLH